MAARSKEGMQQKDLAYKRDDSLWLQSAAISSLIALHAIRKREAVFNGSSLENQGNLRGDLQVEQFVKSPVDL